MKRRTLLAGMLGAPALLAQPAIPLRRLGSTTLTVSALGFGCAPGLKDAALFRRAIDLGVTYFHAGDRDPQFDRDILRVLQPYRRGIAIGLMTRVANTTGAAIDSMLSATRIGVIDIWYLISPRAGRSDWRRDGGLDRSRQAGKVRHIGITSHNLTDDTMRVTAPGSMVEVVMMTYNFLSPPKDLESIERLRARGVGIVPMKTMGGGFQLGGTETPAAIARWIAADSRLHCAPIAVDTIAQLEQNVSASTGSSTIPTANCSLRKGRSLPWAFAACADRVAARVLAASRPPTWCAAPCMRKAIETSGVRAPNWRRYEIPAAATVRRAS